MTLTDAILPPATLGMLGGGQLGRFFVHAAHEMGYQVWVLDPDPNSPAGRVADRHLIAEYEDFAALDQMAEVCAGVTTEFENVPAVTLEYLAKFILVRPGAAAVAVCQNRIAEKTFLADNRLPHGPCLIVRSVDDLAELPTDLFPAILKVARFGYDGKGQTTVRDAAEALHAYNEYGGESCVLEKRLPLDSEVSVVLAREACGDLRVFPLVENRHRHGILDVSIMPARVDTALAARAREVAAHIAMRLDYVGTLAVEFFVCAGQLYVNEMAPRPHHSGHVTLDANIAELSRLVDERVVVSPIEGMVRLGAEDSEVEVHAIGTVYLAIPVPGEKRALVQPGSTIRFVGDGAGDPALEGEIVAVDTEIAVVNGQAVVWASAEIDNHSRRLTPGMIGVAEILPDRQRPALLATLNSLMRGDS